MNIEIRDLRMLQAIARLGSPAAAARELRTSESNICRQLQRIERVTGLIIFRSHRHGMTPTAAGWILLRGADTLLPVVDQLLDAAKKHTEDSRSPQTVRIGSTPNPVLPTIAGAVRSLLEHPPIALRTEESDAALVDLLRGERLELAVLRHRPKLDPPLPDRLGAAVVAEEQVLIGVDDHHRLAQRPTLSLADLVGETCILPASRRSGLRQHFLAAVESAGVGIRLSQAVDEAAATALACATNGVVPAYPFPPPVPGIAYVPLDAPLTRCQLMLAWPRTSRLAEHAGRLTELARQAYP